MSSDSSASRALRAALVEHRDAIADILRRYGATNPRLFGSMARGDAAALSDCDILVDLDPGGGNDLLRIAGVGEELSRLLGLRVDVVTEGLLRDEVAEAVLADAIGL